MKLIALITMIFVITGCFSLKRNSNSNQETVKNVDLVKYSGTWYEVARLPNSFEKGLVGVTATYTLRKDGKINVLNKGRKNTLDGIEKKAKAKAKIPDENEPGKLKVYFFPFIGGDYWIIDLDEENYQYAMVGSPSKKYLWILSRNKILKKEIYDTLLKKAENYGYDISKLYMTPQ